MKDIKNLIIKDITLEWRNKYAFNSMLLYVISTVFMCYMSFKLKTNSIEPITWNTLFWIITLFSAVNTTTRSFYHESTDAYVYFYQICSPSDIILAKITYNFILLFLLNCLGLGVYVAFMGNHIQDLPMFILALGFASLGFAASLTLIAGISAKSDNISGLMAVLSFPIILPILSMIIKLSKNAMDGLAFSKSIDEIMVLAGIDLIIIALSYILYPYIWKS